MAGQHYKKSGQNRPIKWPTAVVGNEAHISDQITDQTGVGQKWGVISDRLPRPPIIGRL